MLYNIRKVKHYLLKRLRCLPSSKALFVGAKPAHWRRLRDLFIYLFVRGFACVTWSSAKEPEAGDGKENEREPGDEVGGACRVEIGHIGFWRVVSCGFFLYCLKTVAGDSKDYGDVN